LALVHEDALTPIEFIRRLTTNAARLLSLEGGSLKVGAVGDVALIDPDKEWVYDPANGFSKSRNSPWAGETLIGKVTATLVDGQLVYHHERTTNLSEPRTRSID
jgi:dihydroorotase